MTTTLCGHERVDLTWALELWDTPDVAHGMMVLPSVHEGPAYTPAKRAALVATHDPAKLAELMAEELRRRDVKAHLGEMHTRPIDALVRVQPIGNERTLLGRLMRCVLLFKYDGVHLKPTWSVSLEEPQSRALLLRLMRLPEGTAAQDVLKALEVGA